MHETEHLCAANTNVYKASTDKILLKHTDKSM